ncbi:MAG: hypothetical protein KDC34_16875 [Saprospiraceae bacterium]|nr:hypothetical protein [Saprospiraceae bacterium]
MKTQKPILLSLLLLAVFQLSAQVTIQSVHLFEDQEQADGEILTVESVLRGEEAVDFALNEDFSNYSYVIIRKSMVMPIKKRDKKQSPTADFKLEDIDAVLFHNTGEAVTIYIQSPEEPQLAMEEQVYRQFILANSSNSQRLRLLAVWENPEETLPGFSFSLSGEGECPEESAALYPLSSQMTFWFQDVSGKTRLKEIFRYTNFPIGGEHAGTPVLEVYVETYALAQK